MSGVIIEGISASGKSIIFEKLTNRDWYREKQSKIQLSEYLTERIVENIEPTVDKRVELLEGYVDILEKVYFNFYNSRFKNTSLERVKPFFILERFHMTHSVEGSSFNAFKDIDNRLNNMNFKLILLMMDENVVKERLIDTFPRRPATWKNYCLSFGGIDGAVEKYVNMQRTLLNFSKETSLSKLIIDTTKMEWDRYIEEIESFIL
ncbi:hypothetical protein FYJ27_09445 [Anaerosalibacter bizertensis]|uniref:Deoxynucleoside kinase domain-containing protein n=1 Tax=Anaerosalibacter bizertensis TaxID=932217 RepID=A0A844FIZ9_9FIRM|nr:hypothetical protein [Anaerosalibacter bizertensis]MSS43949.1 hypothetical protein [Anaerosalibacter bizertensis]